MFASLLHVLSKETSARGRDIVALALAEFKFFFSYKLIDKIVINQVISY